MSAPRAVHDARAPQHLSPSPLPPSGGVVWCGCVVLQNVVAPRPLKLRLSAGLTNSVRCNCSVVDESRSSLAGLAAQGVSFYQKSI